MLICTTADNTIRWKEGERLDHLFEQRCDSVPADHLAVITEDLSLTFGELDRRANQTARYLLEQGVKPGDRVGVLLDKSIHTYVGLLAVLKVGAAYVPFDASFPTDRIAFMLQDAEVKAIVSVSRFATKLGELASRPILLDRVQEQINQQSPVRLAEREVPRSSDSLCYIIYTSGTTGKPKGVAVNHSGVCNFVKVAGEVYGIRPDDRCYQGITLAFDFHVEDYWVPLVGGATLVAGKSGSTLVGGDLHAYLQAQRVTVLVCVPTLLATVEQDLPEVRILLLSGEAAPPNLVARWHRPGRSILNAYGPTETSVTATLSRPLPGKPVTIGVPLPTYTVVILDEETDAVVPDGQPGEIGIAGICLAVGYLNRDDLTRQKFIPDFLDLPNNPSKRIYRSGDLGRITEDGEIEFLGRIDTQVKIRGYRIELGEIEAILAQFPQIAQVVVNPYESEPGQVELVGYFTRKQGVAEICLEELSQTLRKNLPSYMVPAYLEELPAIPMTANHKADRKNLPPPRGSRFSVSSKKYVAPQTPTERVLADALCEIMQLDRASAEDNFFYDLGAHSLLMARFAAEVRKKLKISTVSIQDIYLNPTIERLARLIDSLPARTANAGKPHVPGEPFYIPSYLSYCGCGALQLLFLLGEAALGLWLLVKGVEWSYAAMPDLVATYLRVVAFGVGMFVFYSAIPVALKWLLVGKWKQETFPIWSLRYFRFWVVKHLTRSAPMAQFGGPMLNLYLRLLGAKIGANVVIQSQHLPVCTDLITIGANTILRNDSMLLGYKALSNRIHTGPVHIGANAFVGEATVLDINTTLEDNSQLGHGSSLYAGQRVPQGKHFHGSPGQPTTANYCPIEPRVCTPLRRDIYAALMFFITFAVLPIPMLVAYALWPYVDWLIGDPEFTSAGPGQALVLAGKMLLLSFVVYFGGLALNLLSIGTVPRLLNLFLQKDRTYVLYGFHYFIHQMIVQFSNSGFFNSLLGDSSAIVYYLRWVGYKLNDVEQTGTNFGMNQSHDNPFLCDIGSGTLVSGGLKMVNATMSSSSFKLGVVKIGKRNYLGNYLRISPDSKVGANCLIATKALVPIEGPVRENVGLLGSPSFEIPRAAARDTEMSKMDDETRRRRVHDKNVYNFKTAVLVLLNKWFVFFAATLCGLVGVLFFPRFGMLAFYTAAVVDFCFFVLWAWFTDSAVLGFKKLKPRTVPVLGENSYYWFHERHWKFSGLTDLEPIVAGTPFKNVVSRLQGIRVGKMVFDDGALFCEETLIEIGDYTNLNAESWVQPHSLEEAVFKSDYVKIGACCTLGCMANVHYGVTIGDHVILEPDAFLMKGEIVDSNTILQGNPAKAVGYQVALDAPCETSEALAPAEYAITP